MRKLIAVLSLATCTLAATSIYLWTELQETRRQVMSLAGASAAPPGGRAAAEQSRGARARMTTETTPQSETRTGMTRSAGGAAMTRQQMMEADFREGSRRKLLQLSDPTMRAQMLEEWKEANRPNGRKYARYLGIDNDAAERLIAVLAEQSLAQDEAYARCIVQPPCDLQVVNRESGEARQQALIALLGADAQQRFAHYEYTGVERHMVGQFLRDKIPAGGQLSDG
jgi:hypothetical protein